MIRKGWLFSVFLLAGNAVTAQNLVPNPGFEEYWSIPDYYGQWIRCKDWSNVNGDFNFGFNGSPDYLHEDGPDGVVGLPLCDFGYVFPHSGDAIMGIGMEGDFREYLSTELESPMLPGWTYTVSFWLTNGSDHYHSQAGCDHIGIYLSEQPPVQLSNEPIAVTPQLEIAGEVWSAEWQLVTFTIVPDSPLNYITIGQFAPGAQTSWTVHVPSAPFYSSYYFLDDVSVTATDSIIESKPVSYIDLPNVFTPDGDGANDLFLPVKILAVSETTLRIFDRWGAIMLETTALTDGWDGEFNGKPCSEGVYFWTVDYKSVQGTSFRKQGFVTLIR